MSWQEPLNLVGGAGESIVLNSLLFGTLRQKSFFFPFFDLSVHNFEGRHLNSPDLIVWGIYLVYCIKKKSCYKCIGIQTSHRTHEHPDGGWGGHYQGFFHFDIPVCIMCTGLVFSLHIAIHAQHPWSDAQTKVELHSTLLFYLCSISGKLNRQPSQLLLIPRLQTLFCW